MQAIKCLNKQHDELTWVIQAEKRRTMDMPPERFSSYTERRRSQIGYYPLFLSVIALTIFVVNFVDIGWERRDMQPESHVLLEMGRQDTKRLLVNQEWHRLFTYSFLHSSRQVFEVTPMAVWFMFMAGTRIELRRGSAKIAFIAIVATLAAGVTGSVLFSENRSYGSWIWGHIFLGMNYADIFANWENLTMEMFIHRRKNKNNFFGDVPTTFENSFRYGFRLRAKIPALFLELGMLLYIDCFEPVKYDNSNMLLNILGFGTDSALPYLFSIQ